MSHHITNFAEKLGNGEMIDKYIWLIETLRRSNGLTLSEIDSRWRSSRYNDNGEGLNRRTLLRWRDAISQSFNIKINCDPYDGYRYKINDERGEQERYLDWLIKMQATDNILYNYKSISHYIILEDHYSGRESLGTILQAIKDRKRVSVVYQNFTKSEPNTPMSVSPLCVRLFNKRWYMLAQFNGSIETHEYIMAMDRITKVIILDESYQIPEDFDPEIYFGDFYGIYIDQKLPTKRILIRVPQSQLPYIETLPLHHSQKIVGHSDGYYIVEYHMKITPDLAWAMFDRLRNCQVIEPQDLKDDMLRIAHEIIQTQNQNI